MKGLIPTCLLPAWTLLKETADGTQAFNRPRSLPPLPRQPTSSTSLAFSLVRIEEPATPGGGEGEWKGGGGGREEGVADCGVRRGWGWKKIDLASSL